MSMHTIFIDGAAGTTGLRIEERLGAAADITLLRLPEAQRKDPAARADAMAQADLTFLCLPDEAAREAVAFAPADARICDTSTAHRTAADWVYGFPELHGQREHIRTATRLAVPGCHASGVIALLRPLRERAWLAEHAVPVCHSLTGYSGGGKSMIAEYAAADRADKYAAPRLYGLSLQHKHLPEIQAVCGLTAPPLFTPVVADYYSGMLVSIPLRLADLNGASGADVARLFADYYADEAMIRVHPFNTPQADNMLAANALTGRDSMEILVSGNAEQVLLCACFDNLGKGASGAAVQCMNLMLGRDETAGLVI
ncbi:N-acetyl-gamma-glutamyl-phosphate reductase [Conchiformibius steedae DSM 2580]|uniref:N-acetyl-gamma-glutamyl-phosphate reductase n=1 Tax=Conchiformibius steedae DSM 2580 TaxID=1121352 RepID=A0AAE9KYQ3_9NEIS|nr:N-acetyl-gamma-glutamyl-phosphate reductase [Conchiformibius steedae]QMT34225.1 N-acetyl-gamma-glutamyl-phosphate reductase [Conchiformibius steedae]URD66998.1 N-acetyl-gamma-glutamyl-phosphate reductase [Conchiformibius steedae DSM 2580]